MSKVVDFLKPGLCLNRSPESGVLAKIFVFWTILWIPHVGFASDISAAWDRQADPQKNEVVFRPKQSDPDVDILVKYYPAKPLESKGIDEWLRNRLFNSKAPRGEWKGAGKVIRDNVNLSHGYRSFTQQNGTTGVIIANALSLDQQSVRLSILVFTKNDKNKAYLDQAQKLMVDMINIEKQRVAASGGKLNIESASNKKATKHLAKEKAKQYQYTTPPGEGLSMDQIEALLYTFDFHYAYGGMRMDEDAFLLTKDGRVMKDIPVAPDILDVEKSRSEDSKRWGWWQHDGENYRFAWPDDRHRFELPRGRQIVARPIPPGTRLEGTWGGSSSYTSLDFSSSSFWGITLNKQGRFRKYSSSMMQGGGMSGAGPLVTAASDDEGSAVSVIGNSVGGGSSKRKNSPESNRSGSYYFDGYNLTLTYDNGIIKRVATFTTGDNFYSIWIEGGDLSRQDD
jgi:hypothetical protein